jgi:hypothetical protein
VAVLENFGNPLMSNASSFKPLMGRSRPFIPVFV